VPKFFFNLYNDVTAMDTEGIELPDVAAAIEQARVGAAQIAAELIIAGGRLNPKHRIEIEDEQGQLVSTLWFRDLVDGESG